MLNLIRLKQIEEQKDLGVIVDNKLKFMPHIQAMVNKANRNLGIIKRTLRYLDKSGVFFCCCFFNLYKAIVRPHIEYASTVWSIIYKKDCISLENDGPHVWYTI